MNRFNTLCKSVKKNRGIQNGIKADLRNFRKYQLFCGLNGTGDQSDINDSKDGEKSFVDGFDEFTKVVDNVLIQAQPWY